MCKDNKSQNKISSIVMAVTIGLLTMTFLVVVCAIIMAFLEKESLSTILLMVAIVVLGAIDITAICAYISIKKKEKKCEEENAKSELEKQRIDCFKEIYEKKLNSNPPSDKSGSNKKVKD